MEMSGFRTFSDLGMDDFLFFEESPLEELSSEINGSSFSEDLHHYSFKSQQPALLNYFKRAAVLPESYEFGDSIMPPLKQLKTVTWNSCRPAGSMSDSPSPMVKAKQEEGYSYSGSLMFSHQHIASLSSSVHQNHQQLKRVVDGISTRTNRGHALGERKRREKLSQGFAVLSTLVPGIKKVDKISILGGAIKHMKQLQEKVKALEKQTKKTTMESVVFQVKKYSDDGPAKSSSDEISDQSVPEIEARFCNKEVLISIHCDKRKGILEKIVAEIHKFHLSVVNSSVMTYGHSSLNITVIAEKDEELNMSIKELVKNLCGVIR